MLFACLAKVAPHACRLVQLAKGLAEGSDVGKGDVLAGGDRQETIRLDEHGPRTDGLWDCGDVLGDDR